MPNSFSETSNLDGLDPLAEIKRQKRADTLLAAINTYGASLDKTQVEALMSHICVVLSKTQAPLHKTSHDDLTSLVSIQSSHRSRSKESSSSEERAVDAMIARAKAADAEIARAKAADADKDVCIALLRKTAELLKNWGLDYQDYPLLRQLGEKAEKQQVQTIIAMLEIKVTPRRASSIFSLAPPTLSKPASEVVNLLNDQRKKVKKGSISSRFFGYHARSPRRQALIEAIDLYLLSINANKGMPTQSIHHQWMRDHRDKKFEDADFFNKLNSALAEDCQDVSRSPSPSSLGSGSP